MPRVNVFRVILMGNTIHRSRAGRNDDAVAARPDRKSGIWRRISHESAKQKPSPVSLSASESEFTYNPDPDGKGYLSQVGATSYLFIAFELIFDRFLIHLTDDCE